MTMESGEIGTIQRRRYKRKSVVWAAQIETFLNTFEGTVLEISRGGSRIHMATGQISPGQSVTLHLEKFGAFEAHVVWQSPTAIGIQFVEEPDQIVQRFASVLPLDD